MLTRNKNVFFHSKCITFKDYKSLIKWKWPGIWFYVVVGGCPYNRANGIEDLRDDAILGIHDIEDLVAAGKKSESCPYYASR